LYDLILRAYNLRLSELVCASWTATKRFTVQAKVPVGATKGDLSIMLQRLLEERFGIVVHYEPKILPIYALVVSKNGPKVKTAAVVSSEEEAKGDALPSQPGNAVDGDGFPVIPPSSETKAKVIRGHARLVAKQESMTSFARILSGNVRRTVTDETGLKEKYDFVLTWIATGEQLGPAAPESGSASHGNSSHGETGPSIHEALEKQLGLKLVSRTGPVKVLVVDRINTEATEN
jgi:uncharacterized protein (TIGR03435 family)